MGIIDAKIEPVTIAKLRIFRTGPRGIAVKDGADQVSAQACGQRRRGAATGQGPARSVSFVPHFCSTKFH